MTKQYNIRIRNLNKSDEHPEDTLLVPVNGRIIETHDLLPVTFFIHRTVLGSNPPTFSTYSWTVTELTTGFSMASGKTQKEAIGQLSGRVEHRALTVARLQEIIALNTKQYGKAN